MSDCAAAMGHCLVDITDVLIDLSHEVRLRHVAVCECGLSWTETSQSQAYESWQVHVDVIDAREQRRQS